MKMLYGTKVGAPDWAEDIITTDEARIPAAKEWALKNGFDRLRVAEYHDGDVPDFTKVVN